MSISRFGRHAAALAIATALIGSLAPVSAGAQTAEPDGVIFEETGFIAASNPSSDAVGSGVSGTEWTFWCDGEDPFTQGLDGHVFSLLPEEAATGTAHATLTGDGPAYDLDMHFFNEQCVRTGQSATPDLDESAPVPAGTRYVVAANWFGFGTDATLRIASQDGDDDPEPDPDPEPNPEPDGDGCTGTPDHVWFLGIVYDSEQRGDFKADVRNFETFLATLRETHCIPSSQATILAMEDNYRDPVLGKTYAEGSEAALKSELRRMGAEASEHDDSQFFFFLSSHGLMWTGGLSGGACPATRVAGSFSGLKDGGAEDGDFYDCELGTELNDNFSEQTRMFVAVDCSFCGGFSDSITAASGTIPDGSVPSPSGILGPNRIVVTGCAITTECFGSSDENGGVTYHHMRRVLEGEISCDGWTAPGFPTVQGFDVPVNGEPFNAPDGRCTASEWFFGAVQSAYTTTDLIGIQQQFRIKYGFDSLEDDLLIVGAKSTDPAIATELDLDVSESTGKGRDKKRTLTATLRADGEPVSDRTIRFYCDGTELESHQTDDDGIAVGRSPHNCTNGSHLYEAVFDGDDDYSGAEASERS